MRNSTNRVWPEALRARRCPDLFLPDAFQAHARIDDGDRIRKLTEWIEGFG